MRTIEAHETASDGWRLKCMGEEGRGILFFFADGLSRDLAEQIAEILNKANFNPWKPKDHLPRCMAKFEGLKHVYSCMLEEKHNEPQHRSGGLSWAHGVTG